MILKLNPQKFTNLADMSGIVTVNIISKYNISKDFTNGKAREDRKFWVNLMLNTKFINQKVVVRIVSRDKEEIVSKRGKQFSPKFPLNTMTAIN